jgi:hypothetical protein
MKPKIHKGFRLAHYIWLFTIQYGWPTLAAVLATGLNAFVLKPSTSRNFTINPTIDLSNKVTVENISNWSYGTRCTTSIDELACTISVAERAYHYFNIEPVLNDSDYTSSHPGKIKAIINAVPSKKQGHTTYYIEPNITTITRVFNCVNLE